MAWEVLSIIGTVAFAISGAIVAMEEEYDILGVYILGIVTAFGGGAIRNLLIGVPVSALWEQGSLFLIALVSITIVFVSEAPVKALEHLGQLFRRDRSCRICDTRSPLCRSHEPSGQRSDRCGGLNRKRRRNDPGPSGRKKAACAENGDLRRLGRFGRIHYRHGLGGEAAHVVYPVCFAGRVPCMFVHVQLEAAEPFAAVPQLNRKSRFFVD